MFKLSQLFKPKKTTDVGLQMEALAADYLKAQGLSIIEQNFRCKAGEIDLIAKDSECFVFVEVKYRKGKQFGGALYAISSAKQEKIIKTAQFFLQQAKLNEYNTPCRFDAVTLQGASSNPEISWLKNAF